MNDACRQKIKIGHRANFRAKYKCFPQILFPVRAILRSINFRCTDFITDSADACILVMACVDCARACTEKPFRASLRWLEIVFIFPILVLQIVFQLQFGLSYQCEIYHRYKRNVIESLHYTFSRKPVTMATI